MTVNNMLAAHVHLQDNPSTPLLELGARVGAQRTEQKEAVVLLIRPRAVEMRQVSRVPILSDFGGHGETRFSTTRSRS